MKAAISAALVVCGAVAVIWSVLEPSAAPRVARSAGVVALVVGSLMLLNYLYALALFRRMRRGDRIVGRWTVTPARFEKFRDAERARRKRKNNWRIPRKKWPAGLPLVFSADAVLVGDTYFKLVSRGVSRFWHARIENDSVPYVEFSMALTVIGAGTQSRTARYRGHLRIPIADDAGVEAARVVGHFQKLVSGQAPVAARRQAGG